MLHVVKESSTGTGEATVSIATTDVRGMAVGAASTLHATARTLDVLLSASIKRYDPPDDLGL
jgi:hypothetical protein